MTFGPGSLSARRAWIEILFDEDDPDNLWVALRKESVDRNLDAAVVWVSVVMSLSARRAWIEITNRREFPKWGCRRSPQGERG